MKVKNPYPEDQGFYVQLKIQTCSKCPAATIPYSSQLARFIGEYKSTAVLFFSLLLLLKLNIENDIKLHDAYDVFKKGKYVDHG